MQEKKRVAILVGIALILAITAIALNVMDTEISTTRGQDQESQNGGLVGIDISLSSVEDKGIEENLGESP